MIMIMIMIMIIIIIVVIDHARALDIVAKQPQPYDSHTHPAGT